MGLFDPEYADPSSPEFKKRASAMGPMGTQYGSAFTGAEQATFGALGASGAVGKEQEQLAQALRAQAEGKTPSLAGLQYAQALEQSQAAAASQLASARGLSPAQAQQMLMTRQAAAQQGMAGQSAQLRLQEQMAAQAALGNLLGQRRQQELLGAQQAINLYGTAGGLGERAALSVQEQANIEAQRKQQLVAALLGGVSAGAAPFLGNLAKTGKLIGSARGREMPVEVPGTANFKGDTRSNDTVPAMLSPGEIVLPRSVAQDEDAPDKAKDFVAALKKNKRPSPRAYAEALGRLKELEARMDAMEALADLEAEKEG